MIKGTARQSFKQTKKFNINFGNFSIDKEQVKEEDNSKDDEDHRPQETLIQFIFEEIDSYEAQLVSLEDIEKNNYTSIYKNDQFKTFFALAQKQFITKSTILHKLGEVHEFVTRKAAAKLDRNSQDLEGEEFINFASKVFES